MEPGESNTQHEPKKPYTAPQVTVHGTVEEITKGRGLKATDAPKGSPFV